MQAIELSATIYRNREIHLKLPDEINATTAKVIVMYENNKVSELPKQRVFGQFRDKIKIAKDFDDELQMEFLLGNDK